MFNIQPIGAAAKSLQSCPTLCDPIDGSPPGSPVPGILQARTLEWVAISFSNAWKWKVKVKSLSHVRLFSTPWTAAHQAPLPMGFSRQEYWSGVPLPSLYSPLEFIYWITLLARKGGRDCRDINSEISRWDHYTEPTKATKGTPRTWGRVKNEKYIYEAKLDGLAGQR